MLVCPTSELPIWPSGSPTERPDADSWVKGIFPAKRSRLGVPARRMALSSRSARMPQPSRTARRIRWVGRMRLRYAVATRSVETVPFRAVVLPAWYGSPVDGRPQPSAQARVRAFDWLRGLAVLVMVETHSMVLLRKELLVTRTAAVLDFINGLVAPSFIFAAGFSLA